MLFVGTSIIHPSTEGVFLLCNILDLLIYSYKETYALENVDFSKNLSGLKVLLVEDNELNMEIAKFILENVGIEVTMAKDGREAVNIFEESRENYFDVILMDIMMPVMDGLTATKTIRSLKRQEAKTIPIFAMTANAFLEDKKQKQEEIILCAMYCGKKRNFYLIRQKH